MSYEQSSKVALYAPGMDQVRFRNTFIHMVEQNGWSYAVMDPSVTPSLFMDREEPDALAIYAEADGERKMKSHVSYDRKVEIPSLSDLIVPPLVDIVEEARNRHPRIPIALMTPWVDSNLRSQFESDSADASDISDVVVAVDANMNIDRIKKDLERKSSDRTQAGVLPWLTKIALTHSAV